MGKNTRQKRLDRAMIESVAKPFPWPLAKDPMKKTPIPDRRLAVAGEVSRPFNRHSANACLLVHARSANWRGKWVCISCGVLCTHNLDKDLHCTKRRPAKLAMAPGGELGSGERARHVLAWLNEESGLLEVP